MTVPWMTGVAIAVPLVAVAAVLWFAKGMTWFAAHPRAFGAMLIVLGLLNLGTTAFEPDRRLSLGDLLSLTVALWLVVYGAHTWLRGRPVEVA